jgi:hypothetical protein
MLTCTRRQVISLLTHDALTAMSWETNRKCRTRDLFRDVVSPARIVGVASPQTALCATAALSAPIYNALPASVSGGRSVITQCHPFDTPAASPRRHSGVVRIRVTKRAQAPGGTGKPMSRSSSRG